MRLQRVKGEGSPEGMLREIVLGRQARTHQASKGVKTVVLNRAWFCLPGDLCQCLEIFWIVTTGGGEEGDT